MSRSIGAGRGRGGAPASSRSIGAGRGILGEEIARKVARGTKGAGARAEGEQEEEQVEQEEDQVELQEDGKKQQEEEQEEQMKQEGEQEEELLKQEELQEEEQEQQATKTGSFPSRQKSAIKRMAVKVTLTMKLRQSRKYKTVFLSPEHTDAERAKHRKLVLQLKEKTVAELNRKHSIKGGNILRKN